MRQIEEFLGFQIVQVCRAHRNQATVALGELGLHAGQEMILFMLWLEEGLSHSQFAEQMCVEPPTISKMLQRMETAGLVERRADPDDARVSRVYLTEHGRSLEPQVVDAWRQLEERTLKGLTQAEQMLLRRLLVQVHSNLS